MAEALKRWKDRSKPHAEPEDYVFAENGVPISVEHLAEQIRNDLRRVGVERSQLCEGIGDASTLPRPRLARDVRDHRPRNG